MNALLPFPPRVPVTLLPGGSLPPLRRLLDRSVHHGDSCRIVLIQESEDDSGNPPPISLKQYRAVPADGACICCTLRGDPVHLLAELADYRRRGTLLFDEVMIHPSLTADPARLARRLVEARPLASVYSLDGLAQPNPPDWQPERSRKPDEVILTAPVEAAAEALIERLRAAPTRLRSRDRQTEATENHGQESAVSMTGEPVSEQEIGSFVFRSQAPFHFQRLGKFIASVLQVYGNDLLRYKGVLQFADCPYRVSLWGSRLLMGSEAGALWMEHEQKESVLIFVGRKLPREVLADGLSQCLSDAHAAWQTS